MFVRYRNKKSRDVLPQKVLTLLRLSYKLHGAVAVAFGCSPHFRS
jgi:hypothetical protein